MRPCVFIQTNHRQIVAALVAEYALRRNSRATDAFDTRILHHGDFAFFRAKEGRPYLRGRRRPIWRNDDLQSFTPLRFMPPELMGYRGRAVVIDPDIFAVGDVHELLSRDMEGKAIMVRPPVTPRDGSKLPDGALPSSVMLLDCARLGHWRTERTFNELFDFTTDYSDWMTLKLEDRSTIGFFEETWNHFDTLTPETRLLHNTRRRTQPWKTGLPIDFVVEDKAARKKKPFWKRWLRSLRPAGTADRVERYKPHEDPRQEALFFGLLRECLDNGVVSEAFLRAEIERRHIRPDAFEVMERAPALAA